MLASVVWCVCPDHSGLYAFTALSPISERVERRERVPPHRTASDAGRHLLKLIIVRLPGIRCEGGDYSVFHIVLFFWYTTSKESNARRDEVNLIPSLISSFCNLLLLPDS